MAAALLVLAGCSSTPAPICPRVAVLDQASTLMRYRPGGSGPDDLMFRADIERIDTDCKYSGTGGTELESNVRLHVSAVRGPAMQGDMANTEYFIVITDRSGTVLAKRTFPLRIDFDERQAVTFTEGTWQYFKLYRGSGAGYEIWSGWQLSDSELQHNRAASGVSDPADRP